MARHNTNDIKGKKKLASEVGVDRTVL